MVSSTKRMLSSFVSTRKKDFAFIEHLKKTSGIKNIEVLVYEKSPTLGTLYNSTIGNSFSINSPEIEFEAVPYFFDKNLVSNLSTVYGWKLNGSKVNAPNKNSLVFRNEENKQGRATIGIDISNSTLLQKASESFSLIFGETKNEFQF